MTRDISLLLDGICFPEAPRWRDNRLYFSDIYGDVVRSVDLDGHAEDVVRVDMPSGIGWTPDGTLLVVALRAGNVVAVAPSGERTEISLAGAAKAACNDMVVDERGNAYIGQIGMDVDEFLASGAGDPPVVAPIVHLKDGVARVAGAGEFAFANGMGLTPDGRTLVVAETMGQRLWRLTVGEDGALTDRRVFAELDDLPDGMCLDAEGAAWVAALRSGRFLRIREGGEIADEVVLSEGRIATACVLGGPDRRTLFLCTNSTIHGPDSLVEVGGRIETVTVDVPGAGIP